MPTIRITAKWAGSCAACSKPTPKGSAIEYDPATKQAYHVDCVDRGRPAWLEDDGEGSTLLSSVELAERLGFRKAGEWTDNPDGSGIEGGNLR